MVVCSRMAVSANLQDIMLLFQRVSKRHLWVVSATVLVQCGLSAVVYHCIEGGGGGVQYSKNTKIWKRWILLFFWIQRFLLKNAALYVARIIVASFNFFFFLFLYLFYVTLYYVTTLSVNKRYIYVIKWCQIPQWPKYSLVLSGAHGGLASPGKVLAPLLLYLI